MKHKPILIADSGGTSVNYVYLNSEGEITFFDSFSYQTVYFNDDFFQTSISFWNEKNIDLDTEIYFFGTGLTIENNKRVLEKHFTQDLGFKKVHIASDLLIASIACNGENDGYVGIMGTGSILTFFQNKRLTQTYGGFGYLIGDEGSGYSAGRIILREFLNNQLSKNLEKEIERTIGTKQNVIQKIYAENGKKFISSISSLFLENEEIQKIHKQNILNFITETILKNQIKLSEISFVGSYAYYHRDVLKEILAEHGIILKQVIKTPIKTFDSIERIKLVTTFFNQM